MDPVAKAMSDALDQVRGPDETALRGALDAYQEDRLRLRRSRRACYNRLKASLNRLRTLTEADPDDVAGVTVGDMRDEVEAVTQAFHEFSAYHNASNWGKG